MVTIALDNVRGGSALIGEVGVLGNRQPGGDCVWLVVVARESANQHAPRTRSRKNKHHAIGF